MNKALVAKELLAIARELVAMEFPTEEAMDKYLKDHPGADKSNHKVVPNTDKPHTDRGWNQMVRNVRPKMVKNITKMIDDAKDDAGKKKLQDALANARGGISDKDRRNIVDEAKKKGVNIEYRPFGWD